MEVVSKTSEGAGEYGDILKLFNQTLASVFFITETRVKRSTIRTPLSPSSENIGITFFKMKL
jgi:hypothetical protein